MGIKSHKYYADLVSRKGIIMYKYYADLSRGAKHSKKIGYADLVAKGNIHVRILLFVGNEVWYGSMWVGVCRHVQGSRS